MDFETKAGIAAFGASLAFVFFIIAVKLSVLGFVGWVIYKCLQHFGVI